MQLGQGERLVGRFISAPPFDAAAREAFQILHEPGDHRLERALDVRLVGRRLLAREDQRDPQPCASQPEGLRAKDLAVVGRDRLGEDVRLREPMLIQPILLDHELARPGRGHPLTLLAGTRRPPVVGGQRPSEDSRQVSAVGRDRANHRRQDRAGGDIVDDREFGTVETPIQQPARNVDHRGVDLHVFARAEGSMQPECPARLVRFGLSTPRR
ncbi:hypothetical protein [Microbacterium aurum]